MNAMATAAEDAATILEYIHIPVYDTSITQEHNISTSHVSLKLKSNILFDSCVATPKTLEDTLLTVCPPMFLV